MYYFELNDNEFETKYELAETLREIADEMDNGSMGGITYSGRVWGVSKDDEN